jgi:hypothetical protein
VNRKEIPIPHTQLTMKSFDIIYLKPKQNHHEISVPSHDGKNDEPNQLKTNSDSIRNDSIIESQDNIDIDIVTLVDIKADKLRLLGNDLGVVFDTFNKLDFEKLKLAHEKKNRSKEGSNQQQESFITKIDDHTGK